MSDLIPKATKIILGKQERGLRFTLKAINDIQDYFDKSILDIGQIMTEDRKQFNNVAYILSILINEDIDALNEDGEKRPHIDDKYVIKHLLLGDYKTATKKIFAAAKDTQIQTDNDEPALEGDDNDPTKSE